MSLRVYNSHTVGCGGTEPGGFEMMLHRQLGQDDDLGMAEGVNDPSRAQPSFWFELLETENDNDFIAEFDSNAHQINNPVHILKLLDVNMPTSKGEGVGVSSSSVVLPMVHLLEVEIPAPIQLMSLSPIDRQHSKVLVRLRDVRKSGEVGAIKPRKSKSRSKLDDGQPSIVSVDKTLFGDSIRASSVRAVSLSGTRNVSSTTKSNVGSLGSVGSGSSSGSVSTSSGSVSTSSEVGETDTPLFFNVGIGEIATFEMYLTKSRKKEDVVTSA
eukprot:CAMPEP_0197523056 /NCGR_PEP_ID=MMETSP1318-20131121/8074_1 /TAXON_ID=552666 /ORGANISM="Partenskyella glossopodia, Strain RCC365" /LENGTH=269 /DNA_ID=CAMNT_0043075627 /DNA_START=69 /DNA_END=878 /DNA_ORIENTATION=+